MVGCNLWGRGSGPADRRVDGRRRAAAAIRPGGRHGQRAGRDRRDRPVGHVPGLRPGRRLLHPDCAGAAVSENRRAADPDRRRDRGHAGRGQPGARRGLGLAGLTLWPVAAAKRGQAVPWALRPAPAAAAVAAQFALLAWFGTELIMAGGQVGLAERVMGAAQATWPLAVVLSCYLPVTALAPAREVNQASNA